jgi:flagellar protein FliO/FliZ
VTGYSSYLIETFVTLVAVCLIAFVVLYGARRLGIGRAQGPIHLVGQLPLDARRSVYLVKVGEQVLVVGVAEGGMTKLGEVPATSLPALPIASGAPFATILSRVLTRRAAPVTPAASAASPAPKPEGDA